MISIPLGKPIRYAVVASPGIFNIMQRLNGHDAAALLHQVPCGGRSYQWQFGRDHSSWLSRRAGDARLTISISL